MIRHIRRLAAAFLPAAAILVMLPALPADASSGSLCETFGSWCVGGTLTAGQPAVNVSSPGRTIDFTPGPGGTGTLHSHTATGLCLAPASSSDLLIEWRFCNVTGVAWTWVQAGTTHYFESQHYPGLRLSGDSIRGDQLAACPAGGCGGSWTLQQWTGPS
jgi:hypothetical protein